MTTKPPSIRDLPVTEPLSEMIASGVWEPEHSGWRPFQSKKEASLIFEEKLSLRGSNWQLLPLELGDSAGKFAKSLPYATGSHYSPVVEISYAELFAYYKVDYSNIPCGVPIEFNQDKVMTKGIELDPVLLADETPVTEEWLLGLGCVPLYTNVPGSFVLNEQLVFELVADGHRPVSLTSTWHLYSLGWHKLEGEKQFLTIVPRRCDVYLALKGARQWPEQLASVNNMTEALPMEIETALRTEEPVRGVLPMAVINAMMTLRDWFRGV